MSYTEVFTWDGEALEGAITCRDLTSLRNVIMRGSNLIMPGAAGQRAYARVVDEIDTTLEWVILGRVAWDGGTPLDDVSEQAVENREHYRYLFTTGADSAGRHEVSLEVGPGYVFEGYAQCTGFVAGWEEGGRQIEAITRIVIPAGELTWTGGS